MFEEGSPNGQFLGPFNPTLLSRPVLVLAPGKWAALAACEAGRREMRGRWSTVQHISANGSVHANKRWCMVKKYKNVNTKNYTDICF